MDNPEIFLSIVGSDRMTKKFMIIINRPTVSRRVTNCAFAKVKFYPQIKIPLNKIVKISRISQSLTLVK